MRNKYDDQTELMPIQLHDGNFGTEWGFSNFAYAGY